MVRFLLAAAVVACASALSCKDDSECNNAKEKCHKAAVCIADECAFVAAPQFSPCGANAVCNDGGACVADSRPRRSVAPTITTKANVLKITASSGVDISGSNVQFNIGADSFSAKDLFDKTAGNEDALVAAAASIKTNTDELAAFGDYKGTVSARFDDMANAIKEGNAESSRAVKASNTAQDVQINAANDAQDVKIDVLTSAQASNAGKFTAIEKANTEMTKTLGEVEEATKASGLYDKKSLPKCEQKTVGLQRMLADEFELQMCVLGQDKKYQFIPLATWAKPDISKAKSCKELHEIDKYLPSGVHTIIANDGKTMSVHCDMVTDGGGWTLVAYAGKITGNKRNTVGSKWLLLVDTFGKYDANSPTSKKPFSQMKNPKFRHIFQDSSMIMIKRTSAPKRVMEFKVARRGSWERGQRMEDVPFLRMANGNQGDGAFRNYSPVNVFQGCKHPCYTGYDYNFGSSKVVHNSNCDGCGGWTDNGSNKLSHRAMFYYEVNDGGYSSTQWFHGSPMEMHRSGSPQNKAQDIEFYLREA